MMNAVAKELLSKKKNEKASILSRFFKTGKGEYGEGDKFLGITVPEQRITAKNNMNISFEELFYLLNSEYHEFRLTALIILAYKYEKSNDKERKKIFDFYLKNKNRINNWDLVDLSAHKIVGEYVYETKNEKVIHELSKSNRMWDRRIAMVACYAYIRKSDLKFPIEIATILLDDKHDLMHKAVGWMLRETGKKDVDVLEAFLDKHSYHMPRTTLRYAIERFDKKTRKHYMEQKSIQNTN